MSGRVVLTSPWTRQGLPLAQRPEVEAAIPDGCSLNVMCGPSGPGKPWQFRLYRGEWPNQELLWGPMEVWATSMSLKDAALFALSRHAKDSAA